MAEVGVLGPGLELDKHQIAGPRQTEQVDVAGGETGLAAHNKQVTIEPEIVRRDQLRACLHHLLKVLLAGRWGINQVERLL
jgi:hypothetical protein